MKLWDRLTRPRSTSRVVRQLLHEQRATRLALERIAQALEAQGSQQPQVAGQAFRSPHPEHSPADHSSVSYVDNAEQAKLLNVEAELAKILGRSPTESEMGAAIAELF